MDSPRGRIYLMKGLMEGTVIPSADVVRHLDRCLGCRACETACPSGVHYGEILEATRSHLADAPARSRAKSMGIRLVQQIFPYPRRLRAVLAPVRLAQRAGIWPMLRRFAGAASLLPDLRAAERIPPVVPARGEEKRRVGLLTGCVNSVLFGETNAATVRVLSRNGCRVIVPATQGCCGALHLHSGARETAKALARSLIDAFPEDLDAIAVNAAGCGAAMKEYGHLLRNDASYADRARRFAEKVRDVTELVASLPVEPPAHSIQGRATYHDACHLAHAQGVREPPRALLKAVPGLELVELEDSDLCCGSAGSYNLTEPGMARRLQARKVARIRESGARYVLVANPGCSLQIAAGLRAAGIEAEVLHPIELLDRAYEGKG